MENLSIEELLKIFKKNKSIYWETVNVMNPTKESMEQLDVLFYISSLLRKLGIIVFISND